MAYKAQWASAYVRYSSAQLGTVSVSAPRYHQKLCFVLATRNKLCYTQVRTNWTSWFVWTSLWIQSNILICQSQHIEQLNFREIFILLSGWQNGSSLTTISLCTCVVVVVDLSCLSFAVVRKKRRNNSLFTLLRDTLVRPRCGKLVQVFLQKYLLLGLAWAKTCFYHSAKHSEW